MSSDMMRRQRPGIQNIMQLHDLVIAPSDVQEQVLIFVRRDSPKYHAKSRRLRDESPQMSLEFKIRHRGLEWEHQRDARWDLSSQWIKAVSHNGCNLRGACDKI
jgi:hypothetical protein